MRRNARAGRDPRRLDDQPADGEERLPVAGRRLFPQRAGGLVHAADRERSGPSSGSWRSISTSPRPASAPTASMPARSAISTKDASNLSRTEAARIAAVLPLPKKRGAVAPKGFTRRYGNASRARIGVVARDGLDACVYRWRPRRSASGAAAMEGVSRGRPCRAGTPTGRAARRPNLPRRWRSRRSAGRSGPGAHRDAITLVEDAADADEGVADTVVAGHLRPDRSRTRPKAVQPNWTSVRSSTPIRTTVSPASKVSVRASPSSWKDQSMPSSTFTRTLFADDAGRAGEPAPVGADRVFRALLLGRRLGMSRRGKAEKQRSGSVRVRLLKPMVTR
jgi:hypothetical protein